MIFEFNVKIDANSKEEAEKVLTTLLNVKKHLSNTEILNMPKIWNNPLKKNIVKQNLK